MAAASTGAAAASEAEAEAEAGSGGGDRDAARAPEAAAATEEAATSASGAPRPILLGEGVEAWEAAARRGAEPGRLASGTAAAAGGGAAAAEGAAVAVAVPRLELRLRRCGGGEWRRFAALHYKSAALSAHPGMRAHLVPPRMLELHACHVGRLLV